MKWKKKKRKGFSPLKTPQTFVQFHVREIIHFALQLMKRDKRDLFLSDLYNQKRFTFYDFGLKHMKILCLLLFSVPVSRYSTMKSCLPRREDKES